MSRYEKKGATRQSDAPEKIVLNVTKTAEDVNNHEVMDFNFNGKPIRMIDIDGVSYWVGRDICESLGYQNTIATIKKHCKGVPKRYPLQTAGGRQEVRIINEPDLFRLITHSKLPEAEKFEKWIFEEILPTIRKTGGYGNLNHYTAMGLIEEKIKKETLGRFGIRKMLELILKDVNSDDIAKVTGLHTLAVSKYRHMFKDLLPYLDLNILCPRDAVQAARDKWALHYEQFLLTGK